VGRRSEGQDRQGAARAHIRRDAAGAIGTMCGLDINEVIVFMLSLNSKPLCTDSDDGVLVQTFV
jgi:hypothetical protein